MGDIWLLTYEATPDPGCDAFGTCGGAFVNCWIKAESQDLAECITVAALTELGWSIAELTDAQFIDTTRFEYPEQSIKFIKQAQTDGAVFCFNKWPV